MQTVQFLGESRLKLARIPTPQSDEESLVVRVKASALCGSELPRFRGAYVESSENCNTGHEVAGIVEDAPPHSPYRRGMRVGARVVQGCGQCKTCEQGYETACADKRFWATNGHSEYFKVGLRGIQPVPDGCDWPKAALLTGDGLGVPVRCARRLGDTAGRRILVLGLGPVGLSCAFVQSHRGACVMGADIASYRVKLARDLGVERSVLIHDGNLEPAVMDWTDGNGADIVIVAAGRPEVFTTAARMVKQRGIIFQVGECNHAELDPSAIFLRKEATMLGSWYYTSADWPEMLALHHSGAPYEKLITHTFSFQDAAEAFGIFNAGQSGKVVLTYD